MLRIFKLLFVAILAISCSPEKLAPCVDEAVVPAIFPDYTDVTIPWNLAPLDFKIKQTGRNYQVELSQNKETLIRVFNADGVVRWNEDQWRSALVKSKGGTLKVAVSVEDEKGVWHKYRSFSWFVAAEPVDDYLAYRLINTAYVIFDIMGIYQRNLTSFDESPIFETRGVDRACVNCHSFANQSPDKFLLHVRVNHAGTVIADGKTIRKLNTKTDHTLSSVAYPAWHPDGKHIAFSVNRIGQDFTTDLNNPIEVSDQASDLVVYDLERNEITTSPSVSTKMRENMPCWSADGKWIYYICAPEASDRLTGLTAKYSLCRISYDIVSNTWGNAEILVDAEKSGKSITFPRISPDGKYLVFTASDYGYFTIFHKSADLYVMDLSTMNFRKMEINSDYPESYHSWSANGRWLVFTSKRLDGLYSRLFFCYFDKNGKEHKPFVLPQKDPEAYDKLLVNFNVPELVTGRVSIPSSAIRDAILKDPVPVGFDAKVHPEPQSRAGREGNRKK